MWYFPLAGEFRLAAPPHITGGLLCEEMGLGKTMEVSEHLCLSGNMASARMATASRTVLKRTWWANRLTRSLSSFSSAHLYAHVCVVCKLEPRLAYACAVGPCSQDTDSLHLRWEVRIASNTGGCACLRLYAFRSCLIEDQLFRIDDDDDWHLTSRFRMKLTSNA